MISYQQVHELKASLRELPLEHLWNLWELAKTNGDVDMVPGVKQSIRALLPWAKKVQAIASGIQLESDHPHLVMDVMAHKVLVDLVSKAWLWVKEREAMAPEAFVPTLVTEMQGMQLCK